MMHIRAYGKSDVGAQREHNEDAFLIDQKRRLYLLADGMGGHNAGDVASRMFIQSIQIGANALLDHLDKKKLGPDQRRRALIKNLPELFVRASAAIYSEAQRDASKRGMGTTGLLLLCDEHGTFICHAGDSRVYLFRNNALHQLTEDHSLVMHLLKEGRIRPDQVENHPQKNIILRCVGLHPSVEADTLYIETFPGDIFLMCSDGLTDMVSVGELSDLVRKNKGPRLIDKTIQHANQRGGYDNVTTLVVEVETNTGTMRGLPGIGLTKKFGVIEKVRFLRDIFLFASLSDQDCIKINRILYQREFAKDACIIKQGEVGHEFYIVAQGSVSVWKGSTHLISIGPGGHFGELGLITAQPRSANIVAENDCVLFVIHRDDLMHLLREDKQLGNTLLMAFITHMADRVRDLSTRLSISDATLLPPS